MQVFSYAAAGFEGSLIRVEVFIRRGIPAVDVVGLPDGAVREARERIRVAIQQAGFQFPSGRILINLAPADMRKEGSSFDLALAAAVLAASGQLGKFSDGAGSPGAGEDGQDGSAGAQSGKDGAWLILGELELSGRLRGVKGTLGAVAAALKGGIENFILPLENCGEALAAGAQNIRGLETLSELKEGGEEYSFFGREGTVSYPGRQDMPEERSLVSVPDILDLKGQAYLKRALMVAAAGGHHMLLFGPPGSGKTMAATMLEGLLPDMEENVSFEVSRIWSQAGRLDASGGILRRPPFRMPHHSASLEGLIGGGSHLAPGEISLAHGGVLFLDETPEFQGRILQSLREPLENRRVTIVRAGKSYWFPSDFQLLLAANPCPCGNLGRGDACCVCSPLEIQRYWKKIGGALMDRIDIRIPVEPVEPEILLKKSPESSADLRERIKVAVERQRTRYKGFPFHRNRGLPVSGVQEFCPLSKELENYFALMARKLGFSSRACHSILKLARTISDLADEEEITMEALEEAGQYRRFGDSDLFWDKLR